MLLFLFLRAISTPHNASLQHAYSKNYFLKRHVFLKEQKNSVIEDTLQENHCSVRKKKTFCLYQPKTTVCLTLKTLTPTNELCSPNFTTTVCLGQQFVFFF